MSAIDIIGLLVPLTWFAMLGVEALAPARRFPAQRGWRWIGLGFLLMLATVTSIVPLLIPQDWLARYRLLDGTGLGVIGGTIAGYLVLSFLS